MTTPDRERNPARTREAILDSAERLFAEQGYDATSLSQVGQEAGVSRGTPGYFYGSKPELYRAVLDRCFTEVHHAVQAGRERALASGETPEVVLVSPDELPVDMSELQRAMLRDAVATQRAPAYQ